MTSRSTPSPTPKVRADVEGLARDIHAERNYTAPFGSNECDCRERARRVLSMIPSGYRLIADRDYDRLLLDEGNAVAAAYGGPR